MIRRALFVVALVVAVADSAAAQAASTGKRYRSISGEEFGGERPTWRFRVADAARPGLRALWRESMTAQAERVGCLSGEVVGDSVVVTGMRYLEPRAADHDGISAQQSIDECGPPHFLGTVHTHLPPADGTGTANAMFSGADRGVMELWWRKWRTDGLFCVLHADGVAHCEVLAPGKRMVGVGTAF